MSDTIKLLSSVQDSIVYSKITPIVLMSLGSLYVSIILFQYLKWRYRRRKAKKLRLHRQKLERFWRKQLEPPRIRKPPPSHSTQRLPHLFESTTTLVVLPDDDVSCSSSISNHHAPIYPINLKQVIIKEEDSYTEKQDRNHEKKDDWVEKITNKIINSDRQKRKRRQLLWQWSVSMGYCRYNHGYQLNSLINGLLENRTTNNYKNVVNNITGKSEYANV